MKKFTEKSICDGKCCAKHELCEHFQPASCPGNLEQQFAEAFVRIHGRRPSADEFLAMVHHLAYIGTRPDPGVSPASSVLGASGRKEPANVTIR